MPNYKIELCPLEHFFFGGEKHNEVLDERGNPTGEINTNYYVESSLYPQQTTLLGMLRYFMLMYHDKLIKKSAPSISQEEYKSLVGEKSFDFNINQDHFGKIKEISPLYFTHETKGRYFISPMDLNFDLSEDFELSKAGKPYNPKKDKLDQIRIWNETNNDDVINLSDIIFDVLQTGNEKREKYGSNENAYYQQSMKRMEKEWSFVINAEIDDDIPDKEYFVPFGGEQCLFRVKITRTGFKTFELPSTYNRTHPTIVCISDCFVNIKELNELNNDGKPTIQFGVTDFVSFRNLKSKFGTKNFSALKRKEDDSDHGLVRSNRYQILKRGSVIYPGDKASAEKIIQHITSKNGSTIGFNHIITNLK